MIEERCALLHSSERRSGVCDFQQLPAFSSCNDHKWRSLLWRGAGKQVPSRWQAASTACSRTSGRHRPLKPHYRLIGARTEDPEGAVGSGLLAGLRQLFDDERAAGNVARLPFGLLDHLYLHFLPLFVLCELANARLLTRLCQLFDDERAPGNVARLLVRLLDHLNLHHLKSPHLKNGCGQLAQVLDLDVDEPGAQRALFLVRFLPFVLHGVSPL